MSENGRSPLTIQVDDPALRLAVGEGIFSGLPQDEALGLRFLKLEPGKAWSKVGWREDLVGDSDTGVIAGGVLTTMLDQTCGGAVQAALGKMTPMVTLDLRIDYMRSAEPRREIFCMAHCYKVTRSICFVRGWAYLESPEDPIATASGAFMLLSDEHKGYVRKDAAHEAGDA